MFFSFNEILMFHTHMHIAGKNTSLDFPSKFCIVLLTGNVLLWRNMASLFKLNIFISLLLLWITPAFFFYAIISFDICSTSVLLLQLQYCMKTIWSFFFFFLIQQSSWHAHDTASIDKINNFMHSTFMTWVF